MEKTKLNRQRTNTRLSVKSSSWQVRNLTNVFEMKVLVTGIECLHARHVTSLSREEQDKLLETPHMLSKLFLPRLLTGETMLKSCRGSDVSGAQRDLANLSLEQLLIIRRGTLDFSTESSTHDAHASFLRTLEYIMFDKLARRYHRGSETREVTSSQYYSLGLDLARIIGATELMLEQESRESASALFSSTPLWLFRLDPDDWPGQVAVFKRCDLWIEVYEDTHSDFASVAAGDYVNVVCDKTTGSGRTRVYDCDVYTLDPTQDDLVPFTYRVEKNAQSNLTKEMEQTLQKRRARMSREEQDESPRLSREESPNALANDADLLSARRTEKCVAGRVDEINKASPQREATEPRWKLDRKKTQEAAEMARLEKESGNVSPETTTPREPKDGVPKLEDWLEGRRTPASMHEEEPAPTGFFGYFGICVCCRNSSSSKIEPPITPMPTARVE